MTEYGYKKIVPKDPAALPKRYHARIERLVFDEIPASDNLFRDSDIHKMRGSENYYRIHTGQYRIGCKIHQTTRSNSTG
jgi:mRNA-degrading endonuclease RelE of RelBE toxin-antitoxin system